MRFINCCLLFIGFLGTAFQAHAQQIPKEELLFLTPDWKGERYKYQYAEGWQVINPDSVLVGRALTATFMPGRPDIYRVTDEKGHKKDGRVKSQNAWPIDMLVKGDVYVVDQFGAHLDGPTIGDNLGNSIYTKSGNGIVYNGAIRDINGLKEIGSFTSLYRSYHPSHH